MWFSKINLLNFLTSGIPHSIWNTGSWLPRKEPGDTENARARGKACHPCRLRNWFSSGEWRRGCAKIKAGPSGSNSKSHYQNKVAPKVISLVAIFASRHIFPSVIQSGRSIPLFVFHISWRENWEFVIVMLQLAMKSKIFFIFYLWAIQW